jgi:hypothetical protein
LAASMSCVTLSPSLSVLGFDMLSDILVGSRLGFEAQAVYRDEKWETKRGNNNFATPYRWFRGCPSPFSLVSLSLVSHLPLFSLFIVAVSDHFIIFCAEATSSSLCRKIWYNK